MCRYFLCFHLSPPPLPPNLRPSPLKPAFTCIIEQTSFPLVISFSRRLWRSHDSIFPQFHRGEFQLNYSLLCTPRISPPHARYECVRMARRSGEVNGREGEKNNAFPEHTAWIYPVTEFSSFAANGGVLSPFSRARLPMINQS